jgi:predicted TPR repeat methyltransferase
MAQQDTFEIALEHHRAGRVRQAAAGYREVLERNPAHADANHWMGVLAFQAGRAGQAVSFLEKAAAARPDDAATWHNLAMARLRAGLHDAAIEAFERAAKAAPDRGETLTAWGLAHLVRGRPGDAEAAAFAFRQAALAGVDSPELHQYAGIARLAAGRPDEAVAAFLTALEKNPHEPESWHHLALAYRQLGDDKQVRKALNKALELDPLLARAWYALATLDYEAGNYDIAAALFRKAIKARADYPAAHQGLGRALEGAGRKAEAFAAFSEALRARKRAPSVSRLNEGESAPAATSSKFDADALINSILSTPAPRPRAPVDPLFEGVASLEEKLNNPKTVEFHHALAANANVFAPAHIPSEPLKNLFDRYAETFDQHLRGKLQYTVPELIAEAVAAVRGDDETRYDILDLGCGTGLCGMLLRPMARSLAGVDLSPAMIEKAKARGLYDRLGVGDLVATLNDNPAAFDLLTAADVFLYLGDLNPAFEAAKVALRPGGLLAFTVEAGGGDRYHLHQKTMRYTHSEPYLKRLIAIHGLVEESFTEQTLRVEAEQPVRGFLVVVRVPR